VRRSTAQNVEDGGFWGRCRSNRDRDGALPDQDAPGKRQAAVAEDGAVLKARLGQWLRKYQKRSSCKRSSLWSRGNARFELPRTHFAKLLTLILFVSPQQTCASERQVRPRWVSLVRQGKLLLLTIDA
jgi:hypothetical protein